MKLSFKAVPQLMAQHNVVWVGHGDDRAMFFCYGPHGAGNRRCAVVGLRVL